MVWSYKEKYNTDSKFRAREQKRKRDYGRSSHGRKVKRANYAKHMGTEKGYLREKWNSLQSKSRNYLDRTRNYKRKPTPVLITREEFYELWEQHKKRYGGWFCAYTGESMTHTRSMNESMSNRIKVKSNMSVDRIDSDQGYTRDNIVFCTWDFNDRKGNISLEDIRCILNLLESKKHEME
jgi:hypothetical protein|tara:strand:+ start:905 stop:1444 length:540 start_codon:yes stop_codon:yes gene_type:complete